MSISIVMTQMIMIFILILSGYIMTKLKIVDMTGSRQISAIVSNITNPALLLSGAFTRDSQVTRQDILLVAAVSLMLFFLWFLVGNATTFLALFIVGISLAQVLSKGIILTTLLSIITIPIICMLV